MKTIVLFWCLVEKVIERVRRDKYIILRFILMIFFMFLSYPLY